MSTKNTNSQKTTQYRNSKKTTKTKKNGKRSEAKNSKSERTDISEVLMSNTQPVDINAQLTAEDDRQRIFTGKKHSSTNISNRRIHNATGDEIEKYYNGDDFHAIYDPVYDKDISNIVFTTRSIPIFDLLDYSRDVKKQVELQSLITEARRIFYQNKGRTNSCYDVGLGAGFANHVRHTLRNVAHSAKYGQWSKYLRQEKFMKIVLDIIPESLALPPRVSLESLLTMETKDVHVYPCRISEIPAICNIFEESNTRIPIYRKSGPRGLWRRAVTMDRRIAKYPIYVNLLHPDNLKTVLDMPIANVWFRDDGLCPYVFGKSHMMHIQMPDALKQELAKLSAVDLVPGTYTVTLPKLRYTVTTYDLPPKTNEPKDWIHWSNGGVTRVIEGDIRKINDCDFNKLKISRPNAATNVAISHQNMRTLRQKIEHDNVLIVVGQKSAGKSHLTNVLRDDIDVYDSDDYGDSLKPTLEVMLSTLLQICRLANLSTEYTNRITSQFLFGEEITLDLGRHSLEIRQGFWKWLDNIYREVLAPVDQKNDEKNVLNNTLDTMLYGPFSIKTFSSWVEQTDAKLGRPTVFMVHTDGDGMAVRAVLRAGAMIQLIPGLQPDEDFMTSRPSPFAPLQYVLWNFYKRDMITYGMTGSELKLSLPPSWIKETEW